MKSRAIGKEIRPRGMVIEAIIDAILNLFGNSVSRMLENLYSAIATLSENRPI
jgi:hypothetical protein